MTFLRMKCERNVRTALVIGAGWAGRVVIDTILREPRLRTKVAGIIDDDPQRKNYIYKGVPVIGNRRVLREVAEKNGVGLIVTALSHSQNAELIRNLLHLKMQGVEIMDMPRFYELARGQIPIRHKEDSWFLYTGGFDILHRTLLKNFKRAFDIIAALTGLFLSLPLMGVTALLIKIDSPGGVFFRQERTGQNEKPFFLVKFRTMRAVAGGGSGPAWPRSDDYRITRVGRWLRLTRLDEIPQFLNVLKGDMSLIGPRTERPFFVERLKKKIPYYSFRFIVKPGLTGWAQVNYYHGASTDDAIEKLKYDLYYIKNMSWWLDVLIAFRTFKVVFL